MEDKYIGKIFEQNCGDSLLVIEKTNIKDTTNEGGSYLYRCQFQKYPYETFQIGKVIKNGNVVNPRIEEEEFIKKIWLQNCGDSLKILRKIYVKDKNNWNKTLFECEFIKYPYKIQSDKISIKKGKVNNPKIEQVEFLDKIWPQNCGDSLKIIEKTNDKKDNNYLYKCEFIKYPFVVYRTKQDILRKSCINPEIERIEFLDKIWPQNCGDSLKIIEKTNIKENSKKTSSSYYYKCKFQKYFCEILATKGTIINGKADNPNLPYKSKEGLLKILKEFTKKPSYKELSEKLNIDYTTTINSILKFDLKNYIDFSISFQEEELLNYIKEIYKGKIKSGNSEILKNKEIDIYLPELKLGFEFNGNYWHSELFKNQNYHQEKSLLAQEKDVKIIHIWEWEWIDHKEKIQNFLKDIIKGDKFCVYARKCTLKQLDYKTYAQFCNENHLQGEAGAKVKLGLFYKDELVQIMSFSLPRFTDKYEWEIIRECSKLDYYVIGGKEKLWSYFVKNYHPNSCISYCDFSKFNGKSYLKLGFKKEKLNKPGFVWYNNKTNEIYWRNPYKHKEMKEKGYLKLYDAGQLVFVWNK